MLSLPVRVKSLFSQAFGAPTVAEGTGEECFSHDGALAGLHHLRVKLTGLQATHCELAMAQAPNGYWVVGLPIFGM